jgi:hypothetical protein
MRNFDLFVNVWLCWSEIKFVRQISVKTFIKLFHGFSCGRFVVAQTHVFRIMLSFYALCAKNASVNGGTYIFQEPFECGVF